MGERVLKQATVWIPFIKISKYMIGNEIWPLET